MDPISALFEHETQGSELQALVARLSPDVLASQCLSQLQNREHNLPLTGRLLEILRALTSLEPEHTLSEPQREKLGALREALFTPIYNAAAKLNPMDSREAFIFEDLFKSLCLLHTNKAPSEPEFELLRTLAAGAYDPEQGFFILKELKAKHATADNKEPKKPKPKPAKKASRAKSKSR